MSGFYQGRVGVWEVVRSSDNSNMDCLFRERDYLATDGDRNALNRNDTSFVTDVQYLGFRGTEFNIVPFAVAEGENKNILKAIDIVGEQCHIICPAK